MHLRNPYSVADRWFLHGSMWKNHVVDVNVRCFYEVMASHSENVYMVQQLKDLAWFLKAN